MKRAIVNATTVLAPVLALVLAFAAQARGVDVDDVNGSIHIEGDQQAGELSTVNGGIRVDSGGSAQKVSTVNGGIELGDRVTVDSVETVNGDMASARRRRRRRRRRRIVAGKASNVNGRITLDAAHIGGGIETVSGDVEIGADSRVEGGLLVEQPHGWSWGKSKNPRIVIGPRAIVEGKLDFRREVDLYVSDTAHVGAITGATANKFSGDHP